jgi:hypothetical protein
MMAGNVNSSVGSKIGMASRIQEPKYYGFAANA